MAGLPVLSQDSPCIPRAPITAPTVGPTADDINPASPNTYYTTISPRVLVYQNAGFVSSKVSMHFGPRSRYCFCRLGAFGYDGSG